MPKRMRAYAALAEEKYDLPTYPVLINILKESEAEIPNRYESEFAGLRARQDYTLLDKLRYIQSYMCQEISYVHWFRKLIWIR